MEEKSTSVEPRIREIKSKRELESLAEGDIVLMEIGDEVKKARFEGIQRYEDDLDFINFINLFRRDEVQYGHKYEDRFVFHIRMDEKEIKQIKGEHISLSKENYLHITTLTSVFTFYKNGPFSEFYSLFDKNLSEAGL